jgi:hypothetical protein
MTHDAPEYFKRHELDDTRRFKELSDKIDLRPTKDEIKEVVAEALIEFFTAKGKLSKNVLVTTAVIIGALAVIGGGIKWMLGLIGFSYLAK